MELSEYFKKISGDLKILQGDISKIRDKKKREEKGNLSEIESEAEKNIASFRSLMPRVVLRKNEEEVRNANENPEETMIIDKLNNIFE